MRLVRILTRWIDAVGQRLDAASRGRWALPGLFAGSVVESTVFPWPIEFPMLAYMLRGKRQVIEVTLVVTLGSVVGATLSFAAGLAAFSSLEAYIAGRPYLAESLANAQDRIARLGAPAVSLAMMTPVPVQISSFAAGLATLPFWLFLPAAFLGRLARYSMMGVMVYFFGDKIMDWWRQRPSKWRLAARGAIYFVFLAMVILVFITLI